MDYFPNQIQLFSDKAIYSYQSLYGVTGQELPSVLFGVSRSLFTISSPASLLPLPAKLIVPQQGQFSQCKYDLWMKAQCRAVLDDIHGDTLCIPAYIHEFGNTSNGTPVIKIDGAPLPPSIIGNDGVYQFSQQISTIEIPEIEANISIDLANLAANPMFTTVASGSWYLQLFLQCKIVLWYGTN